MANAEVPMPNAVLISASEIPEESATASGEPAVARAETELRAAGGADGFLNRIQLINLRADLNSLITGDAIRDKINQVFANASSRISSTVNRAIKETAWRDPSAAEQEIKNAISEDVSRTLKIYFPAVNW